MKTPHRAMGWTRDQWTAALQFFNKPCSTLEDYMGCRIHWWACWDNPPCTAQLLFVETRVAHHTMTDYLFNHLAPNCCSDQTEAE